ncbi:alpha-L-fucosidase [Pycnococcus provasolii]
MASTAMHRCHGGLCLRLFLHFVSVSSLVTASSDLYLLKYDMQDVLKAHDPTFVVPNVKDEPLKKWWDVPFGGNGLVGFGVAVDERGIAVMLGRTDIWDKRSRGTRLSTGNNVQYDRPRLPIGQVRWPCRASAANLRIHLFNATVTANVACAEGGGVFLVAYAPPTPKDAVVVQTWVQGQAASKLASPQFEPAVSASPLWLLGNSNKGKGGAKPGKTAYRPNPPAKRKKTRRGAHDASVQTLLAGGGYAVVHGQKGNTLVAVVSGVSGKSADAAAETAAESLDEALSALDDGSMAREHAAWWKHYWVDEGAFVTIPDALLEGLYYIQMYKLGCAIRAHSPVPIDLIGPWLFGPTAWADLHWDLNIQVTHPPLLASNHIGAMRAYTSYVTSPALRRAYKANVPKRMASDSFAAANSASSVDGLATCYWSTSSSCLTEPGRHKGAILGNLLWALFVAHQHAVFTNDSDIVVKQVYPVLVPAVNFYRRLAKVSRSRAGTKYSLPVAASPEYKTNAANTNYDLSLLKWGLRTLISIAESNSGGEALQPAPKLKEWKEMLAGLPHYYRTAREGYGIGDGLRVAIPQRHFSHLLMVYPLALENWENEEARELIRRSSDHWIGLCMKSSACSGYSWVMASLLSSMMGRADAAVGNLTNLFDFRIPRGKPINARKRSGMGSSLGPNTMYGEICKKTFADACPCIESPIFAVEALHSMLFTARQGVLDFFPAAGVSSWRDRGMLSIHRMRAEGGWLVSGAYDPIAGASAWVAVTRPEGVSLSECVLRTRLSGAVAMRTDLSDGVKLTSNAGHRAGHTSSDLVRLEFSAEFRGTVVLYSEDSKDGARVVSWPGFDGALDMDRDTRWGRRGAKPR